MPDPLENLNARLRQLVDQVMREKDPVKFDALGEEIWRVLKERERLAAKPSPPAEAG
jgi:hypothetical protein